MVPRIKMIPSRPEPVPEPPAPKQPSDQDAAQFAADNLKAWSNEQDRLEASKKK
jgi:hypothetical protein